MNKQDFKNYKRKEFNDALSTKCKQEGVTLKVLSDIECSRLRINPDTNTLYVLNNEVFTLQNNGDRVSWDFIGFTKQYNQKGDI